MFLPLLKVKGFCRTSTAGVLPNLEKGSILKGYRKVVVHVFTVEAAIWIGEVVHNAMRSDQPDPFAFRTESPAKICVISVNSTPRNVTHLIDEVPLNIVIGGLELPRPMR